ncbi:uncharacterized protein [Dermacentor albipictus]|uniref:uncharacterized protein n=1 Tax=Dermacentor albipictus TaxID=60249 RepID=UPI0038FCAF4E
MSKRISSQLQEIAAPARTTTPTKSPDLHMRTRCSDVTTQYAIAWEQNTATFSHSLRLAWSPRMLLLKVSPRQLHIYFVAEPTAEDPHKIRLQNIEPNNLHDPQLYVTGTSPTIIHLVEALGIVGMPYLQLMWSRLIRVDLLALIEGNLQI